MNYDDQLAYEETIYALKLENKQLNRSLCESKAKMNTETIKKQNRILLHIRAELEFIKQHPFDLVLIDGSVENISNVINGQTEPIIDEECVEMNSGLVNRNQQITIEITALRDHIEELKDKNIEDLHELYDLYEDELRGIKADRTSIKLDRDIMFQNYRNTVAKLQGDIGVLEAELSARKEDSKVLMKVVEIVKNWDDSTACAFPTLIKILDELVDYTDAPEGPPEITIDESDVLKKIRALIDDWSVNKKGGKQSFFILSMIDDMLKSTQHIDENQDITVTFAWLELP